MKTVYPKTKHGIVHRVTNSYYAYNGWPTLVRDENENLYVAASGFRLMHHSPDGKNIFFVSRDRGETWAGPTVINDSFLDDRDGGLVYLGNGRMLTTWFTLPVSDYDKSGDYYDKITNPERAGEPYASLNRALLEVIFSLPEEEKIGSSYYAISEDYGVTWSKPKRMPISAPHGPALARDGSLLYLGKEFCAPDVLKEDEIAFYKSYDGGESWEQISRLPRPSCLKAHERFCEPHVIELPSGRLLGAFRIEPRYPFTMATAFSDDGGKTWSEAVDLGFPGAPPHLMLHSSGALILTYCRRFPPFGERAIVSYDYGETWEEDYILDERSANGDLGYGSTVEMDDGSLMTVYYQKVEGDKKTSILYTKWNLKKRN